MPYRSPCGPRSPARSSWLTFVCLLPLLASCAAPAMIAPEPTPIPPNLSAECWEGPAYPEGDAPLLDLLAIVAAREAAAAECRAQVRALLKAWPT